LNYPDLQTLVSEQGRLVSAEGLGPLTSRIVKEPAGPMRFQLRRRRFRNRPRRGKLSSC
jgi:hypothetical protein